MLKNSYEFSIQISPELIPSQVRQSEHGKYRILSYDPSILSFDNEEAKLYTSVVIDTSAERIVAYSMPKPCELSVLEAELFATEDAGNFHFEEMIEGTMLNLFYNTCDAKWEIATRNAIGGNYWFYRTQYDITGNVSQSKKRQTTFLEMFIEALGYERTTALQDVSFLNELDKKYSYSFILQHPDNHIVQTFAFPHLYLVGIFDINGTHVVSIPLCEFQQWKVFQNATIPIEFPRTWDFSLETESYENVKTEVLAKCDMGVFLVSNKTGRRAIIENANYARLKELRGNNPNLQYQFLCMHYIGKVDEFISHFPMYKSHFHRFMKQYNDFVAQVQNAYYQYYVLKTKETQPKKYFIHAAAIHHSVYIPSIKPYSETGKIVITKKVVDEYFKNIGPQKLLYYLNQ